MRLKRLIIICSFDCFSSSQQSTANQKIQLLESTIVGRDSSLTKLQEEIAKLRSGQSGASGSVEGHNVVEVLQKKDAEIAKLNEELLQQRQKNQVEASLLISIKHGVWEWWPGFGF